MGGILKFLRGKRPDVTPAQVPALVAAIAVFASQFGIYTFTDGQEKALIGVGILLSGIVFSDAHVRGKRNDHDATIIAAGIHKNGTAPPHEGDPAVPPLVTGDGSGTDGLVSDEEEFENPPPEDDRPAPDIADELDPVRPESGQVPAPPTDDETA